MPRKCLARSSHVRDQSAKALQPIEEPLNDPKAHVAQNRQLYLLRAAIDLNAQANSASTYLSDRL